MKDYLFVIDLVFLIGKGSTDRIRDVTTKGLVDELLDDWRLSDRSLAQKNDFYVDLAHYYFFIFLY
jgi:hypothetical protein